MSQLFALEWDPREIRLMVASGRGRQVVIEQAFSIPCEIDPSAADAAEQIGRRIAAELDARGLGRGEAVVAVGRNSIELRQLQLPPAPDEDLPEMVRFQATREFNELDDKWLLDFVPIDGSADSPRTVLATAIAPAVLRQIEAVCEHAGLKMRRLLLRPCEAALLLEGRPSIDGARSISPGQVVLLVNPSGVEADLTAVVDGTAVFLRTTRISERSASLAGPAGRNPPHHGRGLQPIGRPQDRVDRALRRTSMPTSIWPAPSKRNWRFTSSFSILSAA